MARSTNKRRAERNTVRINIYVPDPEIRRRVKAAAARRDVTVSEYCLEAIRARLADEKPEAAPAGLEEAVKRARRFRAKAFGGRTFKVSSASLIRQTRGRR